MKLRLPLLARILAWFFLNLLVLGLAFYSVFRVQFRLGPDTLLAGRVGERIQAVSEVIAAELKDKPVAEWTGILEKFGKAYKADFTVFRPDGTQVAGEKVSLPEAVESQVAERRGMGEGMGRGPPPGRGPRRGWEVPSGKPVPQFLVHTGNPNRYWVGVRLPITDPEYTRPWPLTLLLESDSLFSGGLFLDLTPWIVMGLAALAFSILFWIPLVRGLTRTLSEMTTVTEQIAQGRFEARVDQARGDELGRLGQAINQMAGRLSGFVTGQKRFLGDIAHELCSPLSRLQMALGILEQRAGPHQKSYVDDLREEVQEISSLVNELLLFSKAGLTSKAAALESVNLAALVEQVLAREAPVAGSVRSEVAPDLWVQAHPELLARALANLVRNALRYAGQAGPVTVSAMEVDGKAILRMVDDGPGVPPQSLQQIFDPFYRGDSSRSRETGGVGLGLAIVKTCIEACQGTVSATNRSPTGLEVEVVLSSSPPPEPESGAQNPAAAAREPGAPASSGNTCSAQNSGLSANSHSGSS